MLMDNNARKREVENYFERKAELYDATDDQWYWQFSDDLLWLMLEHLIFPRYRIEEGIRIVDVGGGTARWTLKMLATFPRAHSTILDLSKPMLEVASRKLEDAKMTDRVTLRNVDVTSKAAFEGLEADLTLCFHNVLGFIANPKPVLEGILKVTRPLGTCVFVVPNFFHGVYFAVNNLGFDVAGHVLAQHSIRFADDCPELALFRPSQLKEWLHEMGFSTVQTFGFPVSLYPGVKETSIDQSTEFYGTLLNDAEARSFLLGLESRACLFEEAASRGNNLLVIAVK